MKKLLRALMFTAGVLALLSLLSYAFAGMPIWAPLPNEPPGQSTSEARAMLIFLFHIGGLVAGVVSCIPDAWKEST